MKYTIVNMNEWTYPDLTNYESASDKAVINTAKNGYACFQVFLYDIDEDKMSISTNISIPSFYQVQYYQMIPVMVEKNPGIEKEQFQPHFPERVAPFYVFECLKPLTETIEPFKNNDGTKTACLYISIKIPAKAIDNKISNIFEFRIGEEKISIPVEINIYDAVIPEEENLKMVVGYAPHLVCEKHNVKYKSEEYFELETKYFKMLRHMRQNMLVTPWLQFSSPDENGKWHIDFKETERFVKKGIELGFKYFLAPAVGKRKSWKGSTILVGPGLEAMSYEGYRFLYDYLEQLKEMLERNNWTDKFYLEVSDEPNEFNATEFRALCGLCKKIFPEIKLLDACSYGDLFGALDVWVPLNSEYDEHKEEFETFRKHGEEIWFYTCCWPRKEKYINRYLDYPLLSTRYLFWGNYKYDLKGYLHWASNFYQPNQNPYESNCPEHRNVDSFIILPPGDTHIMYPGKNEPYMAMRLETHRASAEDFELLKIIEKKDKELADNLCNECFKSFNNIEYNISSFEDCRKKILEEASK